MKIRDRIKELRRVKASAILPNPRNWRTHPKAQQDAMRGILAEVGFAAACVAYETPDGLMLIDGHLRTDTVRDEEIPVLVLDVTEDEANKLLLSMDPLSAMAGKDEDLLRALLESVNLESQAVQDMVNALLPEVVEIPAKEDPGSQESKADELLQKWQVVPGDLWLIGPHRILCGDSGVDEDVMRLMGGSSADSMVTDPPYGVSYCGSVNSKKRAPIANDSGLDYRTWFANFLALAPLAEYNTVFISMSSLELHNLRLAFDDAGFKWGDYLVWVKDCLVLGRKDYNSKLEHIIYGWKGKHKFYGPTNSTNVLEFDRPKKSELHPTQKPVELWQRLIEDGTPVGGIVYEPFSGSGTTMVACANSGRRCYAIELEPKYVACALERMISMGMEARREKQDGS